MRILPNLDACCAHMLQNSEGRHLRSQIHLQQAKDDVRGTCAGSIVKLWMGDYSFGVGGKFTRLDAALAEIDEVHQEMEKVPMLDDIIKAWEKRWEDKH